MDVGVIYAGFIGEKIVVNRDREPPFKIRAVPIQSEHHPKIIGHFIIRIFFAVTPQSKPIEAVSKTQFAEDFGKIIKGVIGEGKFIQMDVGFEIFFPLPA